MVKRHFLLCVLLSTLLVFAAGDRALAASGGGDVKRGPMSKVGSELAVLFDQHQDYLTLEFDKPFVASNRFLPLSDDLVLIDAVATLGTGQLLSDLESLGLRDAARYGAYVSGLLPIQAIGDMAALDSLRYVQPAYFVTNVGDTTSQGDAAMRSDIARTTFGVDGTGVTVGVLSDSFDSLGGATGDVASGDLPPGIVVLEDTAGSDEGRAMMQIVHDVAPGATLAFHTAFGGQAGFAQGISDLATIAGADVMVDDIIYLAEPMFQDGIIAQAVDEVVTNSGVAYFSSAGNNGRDAYESAFSPGGSFPDGFFPTDPTFDPIFGSSAPAFFESTVHDFGGGDFFQSITVPGGSGFRLSLQWDSPFFSVSGGAGSPNDLDIYVLDGSATTVLGGSAFENVGGDAVETLWFFNPAGSGATEFNIIDRELLRPEPGPHEIRSVRPGDDQRIRFDQRYCLRPRQRRWGRGGRGGVLR